MFYKLCTLRPGEQSLGSMCCQGYGVLLILGLMFSVWWRGSMSRTTHVSVLLASFASKNFKKHLSIPSCTLWNVQGLVCYSSLKNYNFKLWFEIIYTFVILFGFNWKKNSKKCQLLAEWNQNGTQKICFFFVIDK